jgi:hypothetical protein
VGERTQWVLDAVLDRPNWNFYTVLRYGTEQVRDARYTSASDGASLIGNHPTPFESQRRPLSSQRDIRYPRALHSPYHSRRCADVWLAFALCVQQVSNSGPWFPHNRRAMSCSFACSDCPPSRCLTHLPILPGGIRAQPRINTLEQIGRGEGTSEGCNECPPNLPLNPANPWSSWRFRATPGPK